MKKLGWVLATFVVATAVLEGYRYFRPLAEAYGAYRDDARTRVLTRKDDRRFGEIEGSVIDVSYTLESAEHLADGAVRLVVVEAIQFQTESGSGPFGNRRIAKTRQRVVMSRREGRWVLSDFREDETEVTELGDVGGE